MRRHSILCLQCVQLSVRSFLTGFEKITVKKLTYYLLLPDCSFILRGEFEIQASWVRLLSTYHLKLLQKQL
jgi:hypothetical protein